MTMTSSPHHHRPSAAAPWPARLGLAVLLAAAAGCGSDDGGAPAPVAVTPPTPITVALSLSTDRVVEEDGTSLTWTFTCSQTPPAGGVTIALSGDQQSIITQWDLFAVYAPGAISGMAGIPADSSPGLDFSRFDIVITNRVATLTLPVFDDDAADSPLPVTWTIAAVSGCTVPAAGASATVTIEDADAPAVAN